MTTTRQEALDDAVKKRVFGVAMNHFEIAEGRTGQNVHVPTKSGKLKSVLLTCEAGRESQFLYPEDTGVEVAVDLTISEDGYLNASRPFEDRAEAEDWDQF